MRDQTDGLFLSSFPFFCLVLSFLFPFSVFVSSNDHHRQSFAAVAAGQSRASHFRFCLQKIFVFLANEMVVVVVVVVILADPLLIGPSPFFGCRRERFLLVRHSIRYYWNG